MPDISMCAQLGCPKSNDCYRFRAIPDRNYQSYFAPIFTDAGCPDFWEIKPGHRLDDEDFNLFRGKVVSIAIKQNNKRG